MSATTTDAAEAQPAPVHRRLFRKLSSRNWVAITNLTELAKTKSFTTAPGLPPRWGVLGVKHTLADDFNFKALDMQWGHLLLFVFSAYFLVSCIFAAMFYYIAVICQDRSHLMGELPPQMSLAEACFWFSVTNLTTVGYGNLSPGSRTANIICTLEHFSGIMMSSLILGVVVMKASLPTSKIVFSRHVLMTQRDGVPHLLIRVGNTRGNFLLNPEIRIAYLRRYMTKEGEVTFRPFKMEFVDPPAMAPCVNIAHEVDANSPLHGKGAADIEAEEGGIFVSVSATDDRSLQTVFSRMVYSYADIKWHHRFADTLVQKEGHRCVDFRKFDELIDVSDAKGQAVLRSISMKSFTPWAKRLPPDDAAGQAGSAGKAGTAPGSADSAMLHAIDECAAKAADAATQTGRVVGRDGHDGMPPTAAGKAASDITDQTAAPSAYSTSQRQTSAATKSTNSEPAVASSRQEPGHGSGHPAPGSKLASEEPSAFKHPGSQHSSASAPASANGQSQLPSGSSSAAPLQNGAHNGRVDASTIPQSPSQKSPQHHATVLGGVRRRVGVLFKSRPAIFH